VNYAILSITRGIACNNTSNGSLMKSVAQVLDVNIMDGVLTRYKYTECDSRYKLNR